MKCEDVKINIPEFIDGKLDESTSSSIHSHIQTCESCREIYSEFNSFLKFTDSFPEIEPPNDMKDEFLMLADMEEMDNKTRVLHIPGWIKVAAVIIFAFGTFSMGYFTGEGRNNNNHLVSEVENLKQQVLLAGLQDYSGPQKIEAVYSVASFETKNNDLVDALVYTMNSDKNINVRLAALNVLSEMIDQNESVKSELINSLVIQEDPLIQISLIQVLTQSGIKEAKDNIEFISNQEKTDPNVNEFAKDMVKTII